MAKEGQLLGLVTVKDVLRHEAAMEHAHHNRSQVNTAALPAQDWRDTVWNMEENAAGLEMVLEEALGRFKGTADGLAGIARKMFGRRAGRTNNGRGRERGGAIDPAEEYELRADDER